MKLTATSDTAPGVLKLSGDLNIYQADLLKLALISEADNGSDLVLDLSEAAACDFTGIQLLYSAAQGFIKRGLRCRVLSASESFAKSVSQLGFPATFPNTDL